jgi:hypothetical protein
MVDRTRTPQKMTLSDYAERVLRPAVEEYFVRYCAQDPVLVTWVRGRPWEDCQ